MDTTITMNPNDVPVTTNKVNKIVLGMIVKNEAHVIQRCLASVIPIVDYYVICDTGSTDGTQEKIKEFFDAVGIPGEVINRPWVDFGTNRSEVLQYARPHGDYTLMIDADEIMEYEGNFDPEVFRKSLTAELYNVFAEFGHTRYHRPQLTSNSRNFYYRGVLHEYVECEGEIKTRGFAPGILNRPIQDGDRSKNPEKYKKDAETFEKALKGPVDPKDLHRYHFYKAQSYRDAGMIKEALDGYIERANLGGWNEEIFYSLFQAGKLKEMLNHPIDESIRLYFQAYEVNPWRGESLWAAARLCRMVARFEQAYNFASLAVELKHPEGALFVAKHVYEWGNLLEFAIAAFWTKRYHEAKAAVEQLIKEGRVPPEEQPKLEFILKNSAYRIDMANLIRNQSTILTGYKN